MESQSSDSLGRTEQWIALALCAAVLLSRAMEHLVAMSWYGYAAFVLALPYPVLRTHWALGGTLGLSWPGAACWVMVTTLASGRDTGVKGIAVWVPCLFYGGWLLFAIAEGAATRSYQLRSAALRMSSPT